MLVLLQVLLPGNKLSPICLQKHYVPFLIDHVALKKAFSQIPDYKELTGCFLLLSIHFPLLTIHYINFMLLVKPDVTDWVCEYYVGSVFLRVTSKSSRKIAKASSSAKSPCPPSFYVFPCVNFEHAQICYIHTIASGI